MGGGDGDSSFPPRGSPGEAAKAPTLYETWNRSGIFGSKGEAAATLLRFILGHAELDRDDERCLVGCVSVLLDTEDS